MPMGRLTAQTMAILNLVKVRPLASAHALDRLTGLIVPYQCVNRCRRRQ
jgi:hypothetical protein